MFDRRQHVALSSPACLRVPTGTKNSHPIAEGFFTVRIVRKVLLTPTQQPTNITTMVVSFAPPTAWYR